MRVGIGNFQVNFLDASWQKEDGGWQLEDVSWQNGGCKLAK